MPPGAIAVFSPVSCIWCVCVRRNAQGHLQSNKRQETMLSDRKRKFNFRYMNGVISMNRRRVSLLLFFPSFLPLSVLLTVFDRIRQVNEKQQWENNWQLFRLAHTCHSVFLCVRIPARAYVWLPHVPRHASQSTRWWDSMRVMRSWPIPSGWGQWNVCECKLLPCCKQ